MIALSQTSARADDRLTNVSDAPAAMREVMRRAKERWGNTARMYGGITPERRLQAVAYGQLYRVNMADAQGVPLMDGLRREDRKRLRAVRRQIKAAHPADFPRLTAKAVGVQLAFLAGMAGLFVFAFGVSGPLHGALRLITFPLRHQQGFWHLARVEAGVFFFAVAFVWAGYNGWLNWVTAIIDWFKAGEAERLRRLDAQQMAAARAAAAAAEAEAKRGRYGPYAIADYQERSPFGDADHARRAAIAGALNGARGGFEPHFED